MSGSSRAVGDRFKTPVAGKVAILGLVSVLLFLSGFSIWAARKTSAAADRARISKGLSDLYDRARFSVAEERSLERQYRLQPYAGTRALFVQNSMTFADSLNEIQRIGDPTDLELVERMSTQHKAYLAAIDRLFTAVDAGRTQLARRIHEEEIDPVFTDIEERIYTASFLHEGEAVESFRSLEETESKVRLGSLVAFAAGLALLAIMAYVDRKRRLLEGEERFRTMVRSSSDVIMIVEASGTVVYQSRPIETPSGERDMVGLRFLDTVASPDRTAAREFMAALDEKASDGEQDLSVELQVGDDDAVTYCEVIGNNLIDNPNVGGIVLTLRDVSERKQAEAAHELLEAQLRQSQKMDAIGQLAGGVAHDFNNLMAIILNYTKFSIEGLEEDDQRRRDLEEVLRAGESATNLTRQLLAFSRKEVAKPTNFVLNDVVTEVENMLGRVLGEQVLFETVLDPELAFVRADKSHLHQIIMNLCVNARDAMVDGGRLVLETSNVIVDESFVAEEPDLVPGDYVCLSVSDSGVGMTDDTQARVFEPFFTTKERGSGTGLGLSTVYGIVAQAGGHVTVRSQLGAGTTFKVYLPSREAPSPEGVESAEAIPSNGRGATILVAEDEPGVRHVVRRILRRNGFEVLLAPSAKEALAILDSTDRKVDLLLTDVVMPGLSGQELATLVEGTASAPKVLFMSGYTDDIITKQGVLRSDKLLLQKPFDEAQLLTKVNEALTTPRATLAVTPAHATG